MRESLVGAEHDNALTETRVSWRPPAPPYWMISRYEHRMLVPLAISRGGVRVLPIFAFEEEAREFLRSDAFLYEADGWRVRQTGPGELLSILHGPCADVKAILLDPSSDPAVEPVAMRRDSFVDFLLGRGRSWFDERRKEERRTAAPAL